MFSLLIAFVTCVHLSHGQFANGTNVSTVLFDNGNFNVSWMHNITTDQLHFAVDVNTTGWVGFGFTFTPQNMVKYDVIVGGRTSAGRNYLNVSYSVISFFLSNCVLKSRFTFIMFNLSFP